MEFSRQRKQKQPVTNDSTQSFIVKSKVGIIRKIVAIVFTSLMWGYTGTIFYMFISGLFNHNDPIISVVKIALKVTNQDIQRVMFLGALFFCLSFLLLSTWRFYNKRRFGSLDRRVAPQPTTDEEILSLNLISPEDYHSLQTSKIIIFEENPVKDLTNEGEDID
ncbi:MAG: hypothetical protein ACRCST_14380 [Turicibacter sp.]